MQEVLDFISRRWTKDCNWLDGNCYYFSLILCSRFPQLQIYYLPITGHFVAGDGLNYYDWHGLYSITENPILLNDIAKTDILWYNRIVRDCIL